MSQRRMIYSKIWTSEQVGYMSKEARLLYIGTITLADDEGRLKGNPAYLRSQIFPYDDTKISDLKTWLKEIIDKGLLNSYSVDQYEYLQHPKWEDYQKIRGDMFRQSTLPMPDTEQTKTRNEVVTKSVQKRTTSKVKLSKDKLNKYKESILSEWNEKQIIVHKSLSKDASKEIEKILGYPANPIENIDDVVAGIIETFGVYSLVLNGTEYWWSHKWNLYEFLRRGYKQFEGKSPEDYKKGRGGSNKTDVI